MMVAPLQGVRVLDTSRGAAGSYASCLLADLGADVLKVEDPGVGDPLRSEPPFTEGGESVAFLALNRGKRGITLQLGKASGRRIFTKLLATHDVLIHNARPALLGALGAGRAALREIRPRLITCSITPFGTSGPYADTSGPELVLEAMAGLLQGSAAVWTSRSGPSLRAAELSAGLYAALGVASALHHAGGEGLDLEVSQFESLASFLSPSLQACLASAEGPPDGGQDPAWSPSGIFPASDTSIAVVVTSEQAWKQLCAALEMEPLVTDERFLTHEDRLNNRPELTRILEEKFSDRTAAEWVEDLSDRGIAASRCVSMKELADDPHLASRGHIASVPDTLLGEVRLVGGPVRVGGVQGSIARSAPLLGEHNGEVLRQMLGYSKAELKRLRDEKII